MPWSSRACIPIRESEAIRLALSAVRAARASFLHGQRCMSLTATFFRFLRPRFSRRTSSDACSDILAVPFKGGPKKFFASIKHGEMGPHWKPSKKELARSSICVRRRWPLRGMGAPPADRLLRPTVPRPRAHWSGDADGGLVWHGILRPHVQGGGLLSAAYQAASSVLIRMGIKKRRRSSRRRDSRAGEAEREENPRGAETLRAGDS